jgi:uncharacterized repeat protein (TIGR01451 family)
MGGKIMRNAETYLRYPEKEKVNKQPFQFFTDYYQCVSAVHKLHYALTFEVMNYFTMKRSILLLAFVLLHLLSTGQHQWQPVGTALVPIQKVHAVGDSLFGSMVQNDRWHLYFDDEGTWRNLPPLSLQGENALDILRFQGKLHALTSQRLLRLDNGKWITLVQVPLKFAAVYRNRIVLYGYFTSIGGQVANSLGTWDGQQAAALKTLSGQVATLTGQAFAMRPIKGKLIFCGDFSNTQIGPTLTRAVVWNDTTWSLPFLPLPGSPDVQDVIEYNGEVFYAIEGGSSSTSGVYKQVGTTLVNIDATAWGLKFWIKAHSLKVHNNRIYALAANDEDINPVWYTFPNGGAKMKREVIVYYDGIKWNDTGDTLWHTLNPLQPESPQLSIIQELVACNNQLYAANVLPHYRTYVCKVASSSTTATVAALDTRKNLCDEDSILRYLPAMISINDGAEVYYTSKYSPVTIEIPQGQNVKVALTGGVPHYQTIGCSDTTFYLNSTLPNPQAAFFYQQPAAAVADVTVQVVGHTGWRARHGFYEDFYITLKNEGTELLKGLQTTFSYPEQSLYFSSTLPAQNITNGQSTYVIDTLAPGQLQFFMVKLLNTTNLSLGDTIQFKATANHTQVDYTPSNNEAILNQVVVGAYDPNNKLVSREGLTEWGGELSYQINFQNMGTDTAYRVVVVDTLPAFLQPESFRLLGSSHAVEVELHNRLLTFAFDDIRLADSATSAEASKGVVQFALGMRNILEPDDTIANRAHIFFDFQPAVVTNLAKTYLLPEPADTTTQPVDTQAVYDTSFKVQPNPSHGLFIVKSHKSGTFSVFSIRGQLVWQGKVLGNLEEQQIDLRHLPTGVYFLKSEHGQSQRIIVRQ